MIMKSFCAEVENTGLYTNMYVVSDENTKDGILIDAGAGIEEIAKYIDLNNIKLKYVVLTHCHADHIAGLRKLRKEYPRVDIVINEADEEGITNSNINASEFMGLENNFPDANILVKDGDVIEFGNQKAHVIHTPGHTAGSMCLLIEDALFSGDTLFKGTYGRTDLETGSEREIMWSIKDKLLALPENTIVYPGHGKITVIREEKRFYL